MSKINKKVVFQNKKQTLTKVTSRKHQELCLDNYIEICEEIISGQFDIAFCSDRSDWEKLAHDLLNNKELAVIKSKLEILDQKLFEAHYLIKHQPKFTQPTHLSKTLDNDLNLIEQNINWAKEELYEFQRDNCEWQKLVQLYYDDTTFWGEVY